MADRTQIQVRFKKAIWVCANCGQEDFTDLNVSGGDTYEHNCSNCNEWTNKFIRYSGSLNYSPTEYYGNPDATPDPIPAKTEQDIADDKQALVDKWWYAYKNPPAYVEPSVDDHKNIIDGRMEEIRAELLRLKEKLTDQELQTYKDVLKDTLDD